MDVECPRQTVENLPNCKLIFKAKGCKITAVSVLKLKENS